MTAPTLLWFREDLRISDNPMLSAAHDLGQPVVAAFVFDSDNAGAWSPGGARRWWLHHSLAALKDSLDKMGVPLWIGSGSALDILPRLASDIGAGAVFWNRRYDPQGIYVDRQLKSHFKKEGVDVRSFCARLLHEPTSIETKDGGSYRVFTPFWRRCLAAQAPRKPLPRVELVGAANPGNSIDIDDLQLLPDHSWADGFSDYWTPGEDGARAALERFIDEALSDYDDGRNRPDVAGSSRLSPHLHHGEISPYQVWHAVLDACPKGLRDDACSTFLSEIGWREFSYHLLYHEPHTPLEPLRTDYQHFPWRDDDEDLRRWQRGCTGYPIVDAGMRELWHTGWMHNRVRMIVASFLVKHLLLPWQLGATWFWDTLVDADLASNTLGWQWAAGSGADAAPYFRIFNPITQAERHDPDGDYIRHWCPELATLPTSHLAAPWKAPTSVLRDAGISLGDQWPRPIIEHMEGRKRALDALETFKKRRD